MAFIGGVILLFIFVAFASVIFFTIVGAVLLIAGIIARIRYYKKTQETSYVTLPPKSASKVPHRVLISIGTVLLALNLGLIGCISIGAVNGVAGEQGYQNDSLHAAVVNGNYDQAKSILESGVSPEANSYAFGRGDYYEEFAGEAPLYAAILRKDKRMVQLLLSYGADPDLPGQAGSIPMELAISQKNDDFFDLLFENSKHKSKPFTAIIKRAKKNYETDREKNCYYLFTAISSLNSHAVEKILESGADPDLAYEGKTAYEYALRVYDDKYAPTEKETEEYGKIAELLKKY